MYGVCKTFTLLIRTLLHKEAFLLTRFSLPRIVTGSQSYLKEDSDKAEFCLAPHTGWLQRDDPGPYPILALSRKALFNGNLFPLLKVLAPV